MNEKTNEKVLIKGEFSRLGLSTQSLIFFSLAIVTLITCFIVATAYGGSPAWAFEGIEYGYYLFFIGIVVFIILGFVYLTKIRELTVTNYRVTGVTASGKRVDLPVSKISAVGTAEFFERVTISTASGVITFHGVLNRDAVLSVISDLLLKQQSETMAEKPKAAESVADEIKKMKELLDQGIISESEFENKKKQLLGL